MVSQSFSLFALALMAVASPSAPRATDDVAQMRTVVDFRNVGTAMYSWFTDNDTSEGDRDDLKLSGPVDWAECPAISFADLQPLLVPIYIGALPENDAWGNPYEFCLERQDFSKRTYLLGIRSSGRDGTFERPDYEPGEFAPADSDSDVVWLDGFFVRKPRSKK